MSTVRPADGSEPLLTLDEVTAVIHGFGHGCTDCFSDVRCPMLSGTNEPRDWVESPSQLNENWASGTAVIRNHARHVDTGEVIPRMSARRDQRRPAVLTGFRGRWVPGRGTIPLPGGPRGRTEVR